MASPALKGVLPVSITLHRVFGVCCIEKKLRYDDDTAKDLPLKESFWESFAILLHPWVISGFLLISSETSILAAVSLPLRSVAFGSCSFDQPDGTLIEYPSAVFVYRVDEYGSFWGMSRSAIITVASSMRNSDAHIRVRLGEILIIVSSF